MSKFIENIIETLPSGMSFEMIFVEGGSFMMGSDSQEAYDRESPIHEVSLGAFYIGKYPVTQALWGAVMGNNPSRFKGLKNPVEQISWDDAQNFIKKLSELTGKEYRLPTEAEWEFAASGGIHTEGYKYSGSDWLKEVGWYDENSGEKTHRVGEKPANELGLFDMSGNILEWCQDWYGDDYYQECLDKGIIRNPEGAVSGDYRVVRGGSWFRYGRFCRVSYRHFDWPKSLGNYIGFRLALSLQP